VGGQGGARGRGFWSIAGVVLSRQTTNIPNKKEVSTKKGERERCLKGVVARGGGRDQAGELQTELSVYPKLPTDLSRTKVGLGKDIEGSREGGTSFAKGG